MQMHIYFVWRSRVKKNTVFGYNNLSKLYRIRYSSHVMLNVPYSVLWWSKLNIPYSVLWYDVNYGGAMGMGCGCCSRILSSCKLG